MSVVRKESVAKIVKPYKDMIDSYIHFMLLEEYREITLDLMDRSFSMYNSIYPYILEYFTEQYKGILTFSLENNILFIENPNIIPLEERGK